MGWFSGKRSMRLQLLIAAILIEVVMLTVLVWNGQRLARHYMLVETQAHLNEMMPLVDAALTGPVVEEDLSTLSELLERIFVNGQIKYIEIQDAAGELLMKKGEYQNLTWMQRTDLARYIEENIQSDRFAFRESLTIQSRVVGYINMQVDISVIHTALHTLFTQGVGIAAFVVFLTVLFLLLAGFALMRHLAILSRAVREVAAGDFSHRVRIDSNDEIGDVAKAINYLLAEVDRSQQKITTQSEEISRLASLSPVGIFQIDQQGRCAYVNPRWCELVGLEAEQALGVGWVKAIHPDDVSRVKEFWQEALEAGSIFEIEFRFNKNNQDVWVAVRAEPLMEDGELVGYIGSMIDVTARKRSDNIIRVMAKGVRQQSYDAFLQETVKNLAALYDIKYAFIGALREDGQHVDIKAIWDGQAYLDEISYNLEGTPCQHVLDKKKNLIAQDVWRTFPDDSFLEDHGIESYFGTVVLSSNEKTMGLISLMDTKPMGKDIWNDPALDVFATRVAVEMERHSTLQALEDQQCHLEDLVRVRTSRMEQLNKELESFCYSVSHDLRAPLRSINGFAQALMEDYIDVFDEQGKDYLSRVCGGANRMSELIDALLEISRVSRKQPVLEDITWASWRMRLIMSCVCAIRADMSM